MKRKMFLGLFLTTAVCLSSAGADAKQSKPVDVAVYYFGNYHVDTPQRFPEKRLLAWTETTAPASTVTFTLSPGMSGWLRKTSSGLYYENGLTLIVR